LDNKNIKNEIIEEIVDSESNWYSVFKEFLIFSGVTFLLYFNYYFTTMMSSMVYYRSSAKNKIQEEVQEQIASIQRYNINHSNKSYLQWTLSSENKFLQNDLRYSEYTLATYIFITPIVFGLIYIMFIQLNLRSKIRVPSTLLSFLIVVILFFNKEFDSLLKEGESIRIIGGQETDFEQEVESMQIDHEEVKIARKGDSVGMKINEKVHEGYKVYKI
jgi:hypothetical protein